MHAQWNAAISWIIFFLSIKNRFILCKVILPEVRRILNFIALYSSIHRTVCPVSMPYGVIVLRLTDNRHCDICVHT